MLKRVFGAKMHGRRLFFSSPAVSPKIGEEGIARFAYDVWDGDPSPLQGVEGKGGAA
jgi:hypothetical protein